ncbi:MAG: nuclear transport factor 2 family protein [Bryobacterales bacterium]|nr:nuclear transport factor 2 family protein [Bryobacterales bacterium]
MDVRDLRGTQAAIDLGLTDSPRKLTLRCALAAIAADDFDRITSCFTEDCHLSIFGFPDIAGQWVGRDAVVSAVRSNFGKVIEQAPLITAMVDHGDVVAMIIDERGLIRATSEQYHIRGSIWFTFREDRICRVDEFLCVV